MKECKYCKTEKPFSEFWKRKDRENQYHYLCKGCAKTRWKGRTEEQKDRYREKRRKEKRLKSPYGLDPDFEGNYKPGTKYNPNTRSLSSQGYWYIWRPGHPNAQQKHGKYNKGRIFEHIFIMAEYLGRPLKENECVHHKNEIRTDNSIENLELWKKGQPAGGRLEDKIKWAKDLLEEYGYEVTKR